MEKLVAYLVKSLVLNKDDVKVSKKETENEVIIEVKVAPDDLGRVLGRNGRNAQAIRTLVNSFKGNFEFPNKRYTIKFD